jgi:hypothetical protein
VARRPAAGWTIRAARSAAPQALVRVFLIFRRDLRVVVIVVMAVSKRLFSVTRDPCG